MPKIQLINWSVKLFSKLFYNSTHYFLMQHPPNAIDHDRDTTELFGNSNGRKLPPFIACDNVIS